jgi:hypothetical protein
MIKTNTFGGGVYVEKQWPSKLTAESLLKHDALMVKNYTLIVRKTPVLNQYILLTGKWRGNNKHGSR